MKSPIGVTRAGSNTQAKIQTFGLTGYTILI